MNIRRLDDIKGGGKKSKKDKKNVETYIGGQSSGLAVEDKDDVESIISRAKKYFLELLK